MPLPEAAVNRAGTEGTERRCVFSGHFGRDWPGDDGDYSACGGYGDSTAGLSCEFQPSQLQRQTWFRLSASSKSCQMSGGKVSSPSFIRFIAIRLAVLTRACRSAGEMPLTRPTIS